MPGLNRGPNRMTEKEAKALADYLRGDHDVEDATIHSNGPLHRWVVNVRFKNKVGKRPGVTYS